MARIRERAFAWLGIAIFSISILALSAAVIIQQLTTHNSTSPTTSQTSCSDTQTEMTLPAPSVYMPTGSVTSLQTTDLASGSGKAAKSGDCLVVKYYGTLASNGMVFDENFTQPTAFAFPLGQGQVIAGWDQGLVGLKVGGTRRLVIPSALAYGSQSPSSAIPANAALVFVVKLIRIQS